MAHLTIQLENYSTSSNGHVWISVMLSHAWQVSPAIQTNLRLLPWNISCNFFTHTHTHMHESIFYPNKPAEGYQPINYTYSKKQTTAYNLPTLPVYFSDSSFVNILPQRRSMQSNCGFLNGIIYTWSSNIQTTIAADSTDAELRSLYSTIKRIISFSYFLTSGAFPDASQSPVQLYGDNNASIKIIQQNKISPCSRHLDILVTFLYEHPHQKYFLIDHINTKLNAADISTKLTSAPTLARHWNFLRGIRFHPPVLSPHQTYLDSLGTAISQLCPTKH